MRLLTYEKMLVRHLARTLLMDAWHSFSLVFHWLKIDVWFEEVIRDSEVKFTISLRDVE